MPNRLARIVAIGAAHHRLAWLHPFLDGNGRVMRLFSDAAFLAEGLDAGGLWSMSRG
ncbi:MAG: Fic family protein [Janthinobacterium lividum]